MIEYPGVALKRIVLAEHKNYVLMLALFFSVSVGFALFWAGHRGDHYENIAHLIIAASAIGMVIALPMFYALTGVVHGLMTMAGGKAPWRNTYAVMGWALFPFTFATFVVLPIELAAFGLLFFSDNPSPYEVKPLVYSVLIGMDGLLTVWSLIIGGKGLALAHSTSVWKSLLVITAVAAVFMLVLFLGAQKILFTS
jgi:hypothetical protein